MFFALGAFQTRSSPFARDRREAETLFLVSTFISLVALTFAIVILVSMHLREEDHARTTSFSPFHYDSFEKTEARGELWSYVANVARANAVAPELLWAMITAESNFNPKARSGKGAMGLMQIMPDTAKELKISDPFNPAENIEGGARYISLLLDQFKGNHEKALAAYNAGPASVKKFGGIPPYRETRQYVSKVMKIYKAEVAKRNPTLSS